MKKYFLFLCLIGAFSMISCNNDDDNERADPVVGDWLLTDVTPSVIDPAGCSEDSTVSINSDGTLKSSFYLSENNCDQREETGDWTYNGNSTYTMQFPGLNQIQGVVNFPNPDTFTFTSEGVTLTFVRLI